MKNRRTKTPLYVTVALLVLVLAFGTVVVRARQFRVAIAYDTHTVQRGDIVRSISGTGRVIASQKETLFAASGGQVNDILVALGDTVDKDDVLLRTAQGAEVRAPFSGEITALHARVNEWLNPGARLMDITDYTSLEIAATVDELDVARISEGQGADIYINALPGEPRKGTIINIAREGSLSAGVMTFGLRVSVSDTARLLIGMSAEIKVETDRATDVIMLPVKVVSYRDGVPYVIIRQSESDTREQTLSLGLSDGLNVEVKQGLSSGDIILFRRVSSNTENPRRPFGGMR